MSKSELVKIRLVPAEKEAFQDAADLAGISLSAWARERLRRAARTELEEAGQQIPFIQPRVGERNGRLIGGLQDTAPETRELDAAG